MAKHDVDDTIGFQEYRGYGFANDLVGLPQGAVAACPPHIELTPNWKAAAHSVH